MRSTFLFLILILGTITISGCLREYNDVVITSIDVMTSPTDEGTKLTITPYIQNNLNSDTGILTIKVKIEEPSTNLIISEKESDIGYIKSRSSYYNSVSLGVSDPGDYFVEVQVFESGKLLAQNSVPVTIKAKPVPGQPADIKLIDMILVITKIYGDGTGAILEVSPGLYNQGGDSKQLTIEVTARADPYNAPTESDEVGIVKSMDRRRGKVTFDLPRNREYTFSVSVSENGKTLVNAKVEDKIKLNELRYNIPMTYVLVEEGKPIPTRKEPGFEVAIAFVSILLVYSIIVRIRKRW